MFKKILFCLITFFVVAGCGAFNMNNKDIHPKEAKQKVKAEGCIQGVLFDGITMEPIPVKSEENPDDGIHVLAKNKMIKAKPTKLKNENLTSEFTICGVPLDNEYPIFATYNGFQLFEGKIKIDSTLAANSTNSHWDIPRHSPVLVGNIKLYSIKDLAKDYVVRVNHNGEPLEDADVLLKPQGWGYGLDAANTLTNVALRHSVLTGKTDDTGSATFAAADLAWGGLYEYYVRPPDGGALIEASSGNTYIGLTSSQTDPYLLNVSLDLVDIALAVVSSSSSKDDPSSDGSITYLFNRDIELYPGSAKVTYASLNHATNAVIADDDASDEDSEQVTIAIDGPKLTLTPVFKTEPDVSKEPALSVTYAGVQVRAVAGQKITEVVSLSPTVVLFGGPTPVFTSITVVSGNNQDNIASKTLPDSIVVVAKDQLGNIMIGETITFAPSGDGSVGSTSVVTGSNGQASTTWTLPSSGTSATVDVGHSATSYQTFNATISTPVLTTIAIISGDGQSAAKGASLTNPIVFETRDQFANPLASVNVDFALTATGGSNDGDLDSKGTSGQVTTNGVGRSSLAWQLDSGAGSSANTCLLTGNPVSTVTVTFTATGI